jgi:acyl-CoA synthetase (AMP-forming)/AMP-acid ligase II
MKTFAKNSEPDLKDDALHAQWLGVMRLHPGVADVAMRKKTTLAGALRILAYVQPAARCNADSLMDHLRCAKPELPRLPDDIVLVSSIPRDDLGKVDVAALDRIEVIDEALALQVQDSVQHALGISADRLAIVVAEQEFSRESVEIDRLLPRPRPHRACTTLDSGESNQESRPALMQGRPLVLPRGTPTSLAGMLVRAAEISTDRTLTHVGFDGAAHIQTYGQLLSDASRVLTGLQALGLKPGQQVLLQMEQTREFITGFWGCILGGFVPVPLSIPQSYSVDNAVIQRARHAWTLLDAPPILTSQNLVQTWISLGQSLRMEGLRVIGLDTMLESAPGNAIHYANPDDLAILLLTSGSTGAPKAVMQTHRTLISRSAAACEVELHTHDSVSVNWMPLDHVGGIVMWHLRDVFSGAAQVLAPTNWVLEDPLRWLDLLSDHRATSTWAPNFAYALINDRAAEITKRRWDLSALRFVLNGGEMIVAATARKFLRLLAPHGLRTDAMRPAWGMSETSSGVTCDFSFTLDSGNDDDATVCVGTAIPGFEARIVDDQDRMLRIGQVGRLQVRGASVTPGYFRNPQRNAEAFTADGWFKTGDLARIDDRGLSITGREKDEIIVNGVNIPAAEIEAAAESVAGVRASCTAACAFRSGGAETDGIALFFSCESDNAARHAAVVAARIREHLAASFGVVPDNLVPLNPEEIPRTSIGKIRRAELRQRLEAGEFDHRRIAAGFDPAQRVPQWCYRPQWLRREIESSDYQSVARTALIVQDESSIAQSLQTRLSKGGWNVCTVQAPASRLAIHGAVPDLLLHPLRGDAGEATAALMELVQILHHAGNVSGRRVRLITWTTRDHAASPAAVAAAAALLRSAMREMPWLVAAVVELADVLDSNIYAELLCRESNGFLAADARVRYSDDHRYVLRLVPASLPLRDEPSLLEPGGRFIVAGGLGGIGAELARHLLTAWNAKLLIVGRRSVDRTETLASLQSLGDVRYVAAPVEDLPALQAAAEAAERDWGACVNGAFHLAGEFHEQPIETETRQGLDRSMTPKLEGARSLRALLAQRPGRQLLVGFGSANGYFGGAGASAYAAANAAMAGFLAADFQDHVEARCLDWSMWAGIGMSRAYADQRATVAAGFDLINARQGMASLDASLRLQDRHLIIGIDHHAPGMRPHVQSAPANLEQLVICHDPEIRVDSAGLPQLRDSFGATLTIAAREMDLKPFALHGRLDRQSLLRRLCDRDDHAAAEPRTDAERFVAAAFAEVLGMPRVGRDEHFLEIGGNSLAATQVISRLRPRFGTAINVRDLFENPTVAALAESLQRRTHGCEQTQEEPLTPSSARIEAEIDVNGLTDEQVTAMLDSLLAAGEESR